jgi:putative hydrolase of HD superfamily
MKELANFLFEVGMLKRTPRSGFQFLGSGGESVAEHILRTVYISYVLANLCPEANKEKLLLTALFHDFLEARTGDLNYMNKKYTTTDEAKAMEDAFKDLPFKEEAESLLKSFWLQDSLESILVKDADNIELLLQLKEQKDLGNPYAADWINFTLQRISTDEAKKLAESILETDSTNWWFDKNSSWWVNAKKD